MTPYDVITLLHVLLAIAAVGANMTYGIGIARAARELADETADGRFL